MLEGPDGVVDMPELERLLDRSATRSRPANLDDALTVALIPVIFTLFMTDFFDTIGTAFAVGRAGELRRRGAASCPRRGAMLLVDSAAAAGGGAMGVSCVTTYIESGAGVTEGARTGLASLVTAGLFALTIFFVPIIAAGRPGRRRSARTRSSTRRWPRRS